MTTSLFSATSQNFTMYARKASQSAAFFPNWRWLQAMEYVDSRNNVQAINPDSISSIPEWEDDQTVIDIYGYQRTLNRFRYPSIAYAIDAHNFNNSTKSAMKIRVMRVAGFSVEEIADFFDTEPENIRTFLRIFWDLEDNWITHERFKLSRIIFPRNNEIVNGDNTLEQEELQRLLMAYRFGKEVIQDLVYETPTSKESVERCVEIIKGCVASAARDAAMMIHATTFRGSRNLRAFLDLNLAGVYAEKPGVGDGGSDSWMREALLKSSDTHMRAIAGGDYKKAAVIRNLLLETVATDKKATQDTESSVPFTLDLDFQEKPKRKELLLGD